MAGDTQITASDLTESEIAIASASDETLFGVYDPIVVSSVPASEPAKQVASEPEDRTTEDIIEDDDDDSPPTDTELAEDDKPVESKKKEPKKEPKEEPEEEEGSISKKSYAQAESIGMSKDEVDALGSDEAFAAVRNMLIEKLASAAPQPQQPEEEEPEKQKTKKTEEKKEPVASDDDDEWTFKLDEVAKEDLEQYPVEMQNLFKENPKLKSELSALKKEMAEIRAGMAAAPVQQQSSGGSDELLFLAELERVDKEFYGDAKTLLNDKTPEIQERARKLIDFMNGIVYQANQGGRSAPPMAEMVEMAHAAAFRKEIAEKKSKETGTRLKKQSARRRSAGKKVSSRPKIDPNMDEEDKEIMELLAATTEFWPSDR